MLKYISIAITLSVLVLTVACTSAPSTPTPRPAPTSAPLPAPTDTATTLPSATATRAIASAQAPTSDATTPTRAARRTATPTESAVTAPGKIPAFSHIFVIVMENKEYGKVIGDPTAPYLNSLAAKYGLATNYTSVAHPSQPNYIALFSGSTQGITDDKPHDLTGNNLADQLEAQGKTWKIFAQNVPLNCFTGQSAKDGEDGQGTYARKHNPAISFLEIAQSPKRCSNITNFSNFDPNAADFQLILPNMCNVMHDCSVEVGDSFLKTFVPRILGSSAWQQGGVLFITFDEGNTDTGGGGHIPTLVISNKVPAGMKSGAAHNHYSLLRTIEDGFGLPCLENTCTANNLSEFFPNAAQ